MNKNIMTAYEKLEKIVKKLGNDYQYENIEHKMIPVLFYDDDAVPQERVERDLKEMNAIVMEFYQTAHDTDEFQICNDFITFFAAYCNFYIKKGLVCRLKDTENTMFGLNKADFTGECNGQLLPYMEEIFQGIYKQDYTHFVKAAEIIPEFSVAHLYLFVFYTSHYYFGKEKIKESPENQKLRQEVCQLEDAMTQRYLSLPSEYQVYVLGSGAYHRQVGSEQNKNFGIDENILPYISTVTNKDIFRRNIETYCRMLISDLTSAQESGSFDTPSRTSFILQFIKNSLKYLDDSECDKIVPLQQNVEDWTAFPPIGRYAGLHIFNQVFQGENYEALIERFNYGSMLKLTNQKLKEANKKLKQANEDKTEIFNSFSHNYKHFQSEALQTMAHSLLQMDEPVLKEYGGRILLEYGSKSDLTKELKMIQMQFHEDDDSLREEIHRSIGKRRINNIMTIDEMLCTALSRCLLSLMYSRQKNDNGSKTNVWSFCFPDKDIDALRKIAEEKIIFSGDAESVKKWYKEYLFPLEVFYSDDWKRVYPKKNDYAAIIITNLLTELIYNIFRYADKNAPVCLSFTDTSETLEITLKNTIAKVDRSKISSTKIGLSSKGSLLKVLDRTGHPIEHYAISPENTQYLTKISLDKKLFFK